MQQLLWVQFEPQDYASGNAHRTGVLRSAVVRVNVERRVTIAVTVYSQIENSRLIGETARYIAQ
jgi:hypothetical protein